MTKALEGAIRGFLEELDLTQNILVMMNLKLKMSKWKENLKELV